MSELFGFCKSLATFPDISKWDTSNVTTMKQTFTHLNSLTSLCDLSK